MSLHIAKLFKNPLVLAGAALVIHIGAAAQAAARAVVLGQHEASDAPYLAARPAH